MSSSEFWLIKMGGNVVLRELDAYCEHLERKRRQGAANCHRWLDTA
ncbi:hypothetical protein SVI_2883 [Shewanella violacea DSS12]|uniref:Uncharacterized protein n=1 Tax=Shewanella violacea (strain JCM 10179 / CIP 106290 / LMG 19151 / DSS12) TaxID=637905 RepID=D4ZMF5_SHEVD|nr:hypothetical protein SVI_2883 [Shewanella violacea DSS12]